MYYLLIWKKNHKFPFSLFESKASNILDLIHTNFWGLTPIPSTTSAQYFLLLLDGCSQFSWLYPLHTKDQELPTFIKFKTLFEKQFSSIIKCLQSNNGGEFKAFAPFLTQQGIRNRCSCPHTSKQNDRFKCKIIHIVEIGLTLLAIYSLSLKF